MSNLRIPATYMRGGTSKGVFLLRDELPLAAQQPGAYRDQLLLRLIGSPDPYAKHIDGMGGASSSTSKTVIIAKSEQPGHDVDYLFGQVAIDRPMVDWSGNCGNLSAAVGPFAIHKGLIDPAKLPSDGIAEIRIWQANIGKTIVAHVPMQGGEVQEQGEFMLDGVAFPSAEIPVDFVAPVEANSHLFPTGKLIDQLDVPGVGCFEATLISAGIPTIFIDAQALGYRGTELQAEINGDQEALAKLELIRAHGALKMGLIDKLDQAQQRQHTPKIAWVAGAQNYQSSSGAEVNAEQIDLVVRAMSMGQLHHAMMGTAAVAIAAAAAIPNTVVCLAAGGSAKAQVRFGHPSGCLSVGAQVSQQARGWQVEQVSMSRSARILMDGWAHVPDPNS